MAGIVGQISKDQQAQLDRISKDQKNKERVKSQKLDKDAFFKLMLEQLKHQDPLQPMDNKDMLAQMSQFSSMEQLGNMVKAQGEMTTATKGVAEKLDKMLSAPTDESGKEILMELKKLNLLLEKHLGLDKGEKKKLNAEAMDVLKEENKEESNG